VTGSGQGPAEAGPSVHSGGLLLDRAEQLRATDGCSRCHARQRRRSSIASDATGDSDV